MQKYFVLFYLTNRLRSSHCAQIRGLILTDDVGGPQPSSFGRAHDEVMACSVGTRILISPFRSPDYCYVVISLSL
jgi:hypothetical protein